MQSSPHTLSSRIFTYYQNDILATRNSLFNSIGKKSPLIKEACESILHEKLKENTTPLWGELFPWFIVDILGIRKELNTNLTSGWLAIYLHTIFIDKYLDHGTYIKPDQLIASSLLAKEGLLNLQKIIAGSKYEKLFEESLSISADCELADVLNKLDFTSLQKKEDISIGKNRILLACAGAIAALNKNNGDLIIEMTNHLLLSLQFLDDIKDIEEDTKTENYTYILSHALQKGYPISRSLSKVEIIEKLYLSGALESVLLKVMGCFKNCFSLLSKLNVRLIKDREAYTFLFSLNTEVSGLYDYLKQNKESYQISHDKQRKIILDEIETRIYRCDLPS